jgi:hypothetical protein
MEADPDKPFVENICLPFLRNSQNADGGWGFHPQLESRVEPTCWALQALQCWSSFGIGSASFDRGFEYLRATQLSDGSWPATPGANAGSWVTSLCCWVLAQVPGCSPGVGAGFRWICQDWPADTTPWRRFLARFSSQRGVAPVNYSYRGWGWTPGTSSWVEPTSFALISLERGNEQSVPSDAARRRNLAEALLYDRMCPGGGWNCGNPLVYGVPGEPLIVPTVWALIALRHHSARPGNVMSLEWLEASVANIQSAGSLALAKICLETYGRNWPGNPTSFHDLYERNGFLESVQTAAWTCLALSDRTSWLSSAGIETT